MSFSKSVKKGTIVKFTGRVVYTGNTSLVVAVTAKDSLTGEAAIEGYITFVTIDKDTEKKMPHKVVLDDVSSEEEQQLRTNAKRLLEQRV